MRAKKPDNPKNSNTENGIGCRVIIPIIGDTKKIFEDPEHELTKNYIFGRTG